MTSRPAPAPALAPVLPDENPGRRPLLNFFLDALIGLATMMGVSLALVIGWAFVRGLMLARRAGAHPDPAAITASIGQPGASMQMLMVLAGGLASGALLYFWRRPASAIERRASLVAMARPATWGWAFAVALAVMAFSQLVSSAGAALGIKPEPTNLPLMEAAMSQAPVFLFLFAVLLAPAYEELLFRRVLFGRLLQAGRPWLGMVLSSLCFALMHEVPGSSGNGPLAIGLLWLVYGSMGAAFAWLYRRTGTLAASILAHGLNNAAALAGLYLFGAH